MALDINQDAGWKMYFWGSTLVVRPAAIARPRHDARFWRFRGAWNECWLGPVNDMLGWGSSPYMDWFFEEFYIHASARNN